MKDFFERLNVLGRPRRSDIIEKDFHLHRLLYQISQDEYLRENLAFKGGTCLVKAYAGYYRFSEDIDFTWKDTSIWKGRTPSQTRRLCSRELDVVLEHLKGIANNLGLDFSGDKGDTRQVHISSGGRMAVFFLDYRSEIEDRPSRIKAEVNFVDETQYPLHTKRLSSYVESIDSEEIEFLYKELWEEYTSEIKLVCYDPRDIYVEKARASMTRKAYKLRDVIDIYYLESRFGYTIPEYQDAIREKVGFMLDLYKRYKENIEFIEFPTKEVLQSEEMKLLLTTPPPDLEKEIQRIHRQLEKVREELLGRSS